jgi:hypothetical protein
LIRRLAMVLAAAAVLAACGDVVVGPVDHSCPTKPWKGPDAGGCGPARG